MHLISSAEITKNELLAYIQSADQMRFRVTNQQRDSYGVRPGDLNPSNRQRPGDFNPELPQHPTKTLITMFYEPSTRTNCSFQAAAIKLGAKVIALTEKASSAEKGESLEDTIQTLQYYGDAIVLRHPDKGSAERAAYVSNIPIINGGDGNGEHPTQALLDIYTLYSELALRGIHLHSDHRPHINITFVGDLKNSRTIHSLIRLLIRFPKLRFNYISPASLEMPADLVNYVSGFNQYDQNKINCLENVIDQTDVLYMTRIQRERFETEDAYRAVMAESESYCLTTDLLEEANEKMIIMHPLPRLEEIPPEIDADERAVYFKQVENGLYMRMAILHKIFG
jgi:carbamoyl-phosphate synthase/aspartate carbamoyltransferase